MNETRTTKAQEPGEERLEKRRELEAFLFLTLLLAPLVAIVVVAGYGFIVWMYQIIAGPPSV